MITRMDGWMDDISNVACQRGAEGGYEDMIACGEPDETKYYDNNDNKVKIGWLMMK